MAELLSHLSSLLRRIQHNTQQKLRHASISHQIVLNIILVVIFTVLFSGIPAILLLKFQLEEHAFLQVQNAQSATLALYRAEKNRLLKLVELSSERPTLKSLVANGDKQAIAVYLDSLREDTPAYILEVISSDFEFSIQSGSFIKDFSEEFLTSHKLPFADFIILNNPTRAAIVAVDGINPGEGSTTDTSSWVVGMKILDDELMQNLFQQTGLEQSVIFNGQRVATSFSNSVDWQLNPEAISDVTNLHSLCCTMGSNENQPYYVGMAPLMDSEGQLVAVSEVALPGETIQNRIHTAIGYFIGTSVLIALIGVTLAMVLTRRITRPLLSLAQSAERMGYGDLITPIPISSGWIEINQLAAQLELSRKHLKQILFFTRSELKRIVHLLGATKEGLVVLNENGEITWFNLEVIRIMGYRPIDLFHKHHSKIFRPATGNIPALNKVLLTPGDQQLKMHLTILNAQNKPITLAVSATELENENGIDEHKERVLTIRDIHNDQEIDLLRSDFLSYIAHEFHTPLSSISAVIELLEEYGLNLTSDELSKLLSTMRLSSTHLNALVNNLLEYTIIEAGCFQLNYRTIRLDKLLANVCEIMAPLIDRHHQKLEFDSPKEPQTIWADPDRLIQVLINLLENASKFSPEDTQITIKVQIQDETLLFAVLDSGPGLSQVDFSGMFNHFVASDHPRSAQFGIGLGIPVVRAIVEAHGGEFGAENQPAGGAKVWFTLPIRKNVAQEDDQWRRYLW